MQNEDLIALAERVERLEGPDWEVDRVIFATVSPGSFEDAKEAATYANPRYYGNRADWRYLREIGLPQYTASLDASTAVFPEGWLYRSGHDGAGPNPEDFYCEAIGPAPECVHVRSVAATEPCARLACALRSRALSTTEER